MVIRPNSDVILLKSPLELDQSNQLNFANAQAQYNYFYNLPKLIVGEDFTYIRQDNVIRVDELIDNIYQYNYVMYRNDAYSNKWFYAFIEKMEFVNDRVTNIIIKTDVFQTWQFDLNYKQTFVEREHVNDDTIGANTIPESIEYGDYQIIDARYSTLYEANDAWDNFLVCFCVSAYTNGISDIVNERHSIGSVFSSLHFFAVHDFDQARLVIKAYEADSDVTSDAIINVYMIPRCCVDIDMATNTIASTGNVPSNLGNSSTGSVYAFPVLDSYTSGTYSIQQPDTLVGGYRPRNAKLYTYPYSYFYATNKVGEEVEYRWEDFPLERIGDYTARTAEYKKIMIPSTSVSAKLFFTNYKTYSDDTYATRMYNYGINYAKIPVCAWTTDYYTNWLTQNGINVASSITSGVFGGLMGLGAGMITGNPMGVIGGGQSAISSITSTMGQIQQAKTTPPQAHGDINTGDVIFAYAKNTITFYMMSIKPEYASVIDSYFDRFGYKVNKVKVPNITGRYNWNYVKTIDCYIEADIPQDDLQEIKNMFDNGITIWHRPDTFMNYSQSNPII